MTIPPVPGSEPARELAATGKALASQVIKEIGKVVVGMEDVTRQLLIAMLASGHVLLEGVPGVAKTTLSKAFAKLLGCDFSRVQFTPDLLPSDVTGTSIFDRKTNDFILRKGPIFCQVLLADEINRAPAKTQSALLEAMQEYQVTVEGTTMPLPRPFLVLATQNPVEQEGVYRLPEAQLDRFMFNVKVDYPTLDEEKRILGMTAKDEVGEIQKILSGKSIINLQRLVRSVPVGDFVIDFVTRLVRATRPKDPTAPEFVKKMVDFGAGVRAGQYLIQAGKAFAAMDGRFSVAVEDIRKAAVPVLRHRIGTNFQAQAEGKASEDIIELLLKTVGEPEPPKYGAKKRL